MRTFPKAKSETGSSGYSVFFKVLDQFPSRLISPGYNEDNLTHTVFDPEAKPLQKNKNKKEGSHFTLDIWEVKVQTQEQVFK